MNKQQLLYDVYVSYPPSVDHDRVDACIRDNLPDTEAEDLIAALESHPQAIIANNALGKSEKMHSIISAI